MAPLLAVAGARVVAWDCRSLLVAANALTPFLFLPAWPVAIAAGLARRVMLFAAALVVVIAHVAFLAPELSARGPLPAPAPASRSVRLFDANVYAWNDRAGGIAEEIRASRPDVVFLQEATVDTEGGPLRLYAVHVVAPFGGGREQWADEMGHITGAVRAERLPVLVAGDFNATWGNRSFRRLLDAGLTDAAAARGRPFQMTWRQGGLLPPLTRIDHVLTTRELAVIAIRTGEGRGSDHRPVVADVVRTAGPG